MNTQRPVPANSTEIAHPQGLGVVYSYTNANGKPSAIAYTGKRTKKSWHYFFANGNQRDTYIRNFLIKLSDKAQARSERHKIRNDYDATKDFAVDDIIVNSWGYEQTNIDFYQVVAVTRRFVSLRQIKSNEVRDPHQHALSGTATPRLNDWIDESLVPERHGAYRGYDDAPRVKFKYGTGDKWDGKPKRWTSYA